MKSKHAPLLLSALFMLLFQLNAFSQKQATQSAKTTPVREVNTAPGRSHPETVITTPKRPAQKKTHPKTPVVSTPKQELNLDPQNGEAVISTPKAQTGHAVSANAVVDSSLNKTTPAPATKQAKKAKKRS